MKVLGIVAEYNPFHLGHAYHVRTAQQQTGASAVVAIMSGPWTQRGEVAILDKWQRTHMALCGGIDLVLELPAAFVLQSADHFARGALLSLGQTQIVTDLAFGSESGDLSAITQTAQHLAHESETYQQALQDALQIGHAYPKAVSLALAKVYDNTFLTRATPNDRLAVLYAKTVEMEQLPFQLCAIKRAGTYFPSEARGGFVGATQLRYWMRSMDTRWQNHLQPELVPLIHAWQTETGTFATTEQLYSPLVSKLYTTTAAALRKRYQLREGLENRILQAAYTTTSYTTLVEAIASRRYTTADIQRILARILIDAPPYQALPRYLRVLGFTTKGQHLLQMMKKQARLPIITNMGRAYRHLGDTDRVLLDLDIRAQNIAELAKPRPATPRSNRDFYLGPIRKQ